MNIFNIMNKPNKDNTAKYLEELITELISGEDKHKTFKSIKNTLNSMTDDVCEDIYIGKKSNSFYGMSVYLAQNELESVSKHIVDNNMTSKDVTNWITNLHLHYVIEIDPNILTPLYKFSPSEITAILLHELGHVTADSDFYNDLKESYKKALFNLKNNEMCYIDAGNGTTELGMVYIMSAIQQTHISKYGDDRLREQIADKFVVEMGYGKELESVIEKFSMIYKSRYVRKKIEDITDVEAETYVHLITTFKQRQTYVTDLLKTESSMNNSNFVSDMLKTIKDKLSKIMIHESAYTYGKKMLSESFMDLFTSNPVKVCQDDIDQLKIEIEMVEDYDDKSVVVYKIHKRMTQLTNIKEKLDVNNRDYKYNNNLIDSYMKQLQKMLDDAMKYKVVPKSYGIFIKYPKGYEG